MKRNRMDDHSRWMSGIDRRIRNQRLYGKMLLEWKWERTYLLLYQTDEWGWFYEGIAEYPDILVEMSKERVIVADVHRRCFLTIDKENVTWMGHHRVLDLNDDGERWEGDVLHDMPCGWGVLFDKDNAIIYEGFRIGAVNVCYGRSYYSDIHKLEYEGEICEGKRWGRGVQYDRNGKVVFDGEWLNDEHHVEKRTTIVRVNHVMHTLLEDLTVSDECCNGAEWKEFDFCIMSNLRELRVGNGCFGRVETVNLLRLDRLEKVVVGENSFTQHRNGYGKEQSHFCLKECPMLRELRVGRYSFSDYSVCEIESVNRLEVIEMGDLFMDNHNFDHASLVLKGNVVLWE